MSETDRFIGMTVADLAKWVESESGMPAIWSVGAEVVNEVSRAMRKHAAMHSAHEGYAVILEELDEMWDEVKRQKVDPIALRKEAIQVAAMAIRFVLDVCDKEAPRG